MGDAKVGQLVCDDLLAFEEQDTLMKLRKIDDNIIYTLNATIPSSVARIEDSNRLTNDCSDLWSQLVVAYKNRENAIRKCISTVSSNVDQLKEKQSQNSADQVILKQLKKEQSKLRTFQKELGVEEIVRNRSKKIFYERCRNYFRPAVEINL